MSKEKPTARRETPQESNPGNVDRPSPSPASPAETPSSNTASPYGRDEVQRQNTSATVDSQSPPETRTVDRKTKDKAPEPDQPLNPKRTRHSRPS